MIRLTALLIILTLMSSVLGLANSDSRPEDSLPFEDRLALCEDLEISLLPTEIMALSSGAVFQNGADRLADLQNIDGGWDRPLYDGNPAKGSEPSTVGPITKGLAVAYVYTNDPDHRAALQAAGAFLCAKKNNFSPHDGYLAAALDHIFGGKTYTDYVMKNFYGPLAAGTYVRKRAGHRYDGTRYDVTQYDTAGYVNWIRTTRASQGFPNLAAWDIGMGLVGAKAAGADTTAWIAGVKAEIDELNGKDDYDVIGLAGAIYGLAYVGEDYDPVDGAHASASSLEDLGWVLARYQLATGGFIQNSKDLEKGKNNETNETIEGTAYAILALAELDRTTYLNKIQAAADYIESKQLSTGGWKNRAGESENNQVTGEALWGIATAYDSPPVDAPPIAEANGPYLAAVGGSIDLDHTGSNDPDGDPLSYAWAVTDPALGTITNETFTAGNTAGITDVTLTVDDGRGETATDTARVIVYDPGGGCVAGSGWVDSPAGAYKPDPTLESKATFGFVSMYKEGADQPIGNTEFHFKAGDLNFHSTSFDWLVVTGNNYAQFKGTGTINGDPGPYGNAYQFLIWAGDNQPDTFHIRIWYEEGENEIVVYDNGGDQSIGGGSIVIHRAKE